MKPYLHIRRHPYEEPYLLNLVIAVSSGTAYGEMECYINTQNLHDWAAHLEQFPRYNGDIFRAEVGSEYPEDRYAYYFRFRAITIDKVGHCALHFRFNNNSDLPDRLISEFCLKVEPAQINRLGNLIREFAEMKHELLVWTPEDGELYAHHFEYLG